MCIRQCLFCSKTFTLTKKHPNNVYCSRACVMRKNAIAQRLPPMVCQQCGKSFTGESKERKYCSMRCAGIASNIGRQRRPIAERFWECVDKTGDCWLWTGTLSTHGYGLISIDSRWRLAPRIAWELYHGELPGKKHVLHRCDNPRCVRDDHLFLGTHQDNMKDKVKKRRHYYGEKHQNHILTESTVKIIRASALSNAELAMQYGVNASVISRVRAGKAWKHVK